MRALVIAILIGALIAIIGSSAYASIVIGPAEYHGADPETGDPMVLYGMTVKLTDPDSKISSMSLIGGGNNDVSIISGPGSGGGWQKTGYDSDTDTQHFALPNGIYMQGNGTYVDLSACVRKPKAANVDLYDPKTGKSNVIQEYQYPAEPGTVASLLFGALGIATKRRLFKKKV